MLPSKRLLILGWVLLGGLVLAAATPIIDSNPQGVGGGVVVSVTAGTVNAGIVDAGIVCVNGSCLSSVPPANAITSNSPTALATTALVTSDVNYVMATQTLNVGSTGGGVYSFATLGTAAIFMISATHGIITSVGSIINGGSGFAAGDLVTPANGNFDAVVQITSVGGGGNATGAAVLYGGTGYTNGFQGAVSAAGALPFTFTFNGTLTSDATVIMPNGPAAQLSNQWIFNNNTTGAYTMTVCLSNGADACTANTVKIPQGINNNNGILVETDGLDAGVFLLSISPNILIGTNGSSIGMNSGGNIVLGAVDGGAVEVPAATGIQFGNDAGISPGPVAGQVAFNSTAAQSPSALLGNCADNQGYTCLGPYEAGGSAVANAALRFNGAATVLNSSSLYFELNGTPAFVCDATLGACYVPASTALGFDNEGGGAGGNIQQSSGTLYISSATGNNINLRAGSTTEAVISTSGLTVGSGSAVSSTCVAAQGGCSMASGATTCTVACTGCTSSSSCFSGPFGTAATADAVGVSAACSTGTVTLTAKTAPTAAAETFNVHCFN